MKLSKYSWSGSDECGLCKVCEQCFSGCSTDMITAFCPHLHYCCLPMVDPQGLCDYLFQQMPVLMQFKAVHLDIFMHPNLFSCMHVCQRSVCRKPFCLCQHYVTKNWTFCVSSTSAYVCDVFSLFVLILSCFVVSDAVYVLIFSPASKINGERETNVCCYLLVMTWKAISLGFLGDRQ